MLYFDVTKASRQSHHSGLVRVSVCLRRELATARPGGWQEVVWHTRRKAFVGRSSGRVVSPGAGDVFFTPELFSEEERPGVTAWLEGATCRTAALYHDAIPLRFPEITWSKSVARHPGYMRLLARFGVVLANSHASCVELADYWRWMQVGGPDPVLLPLGADGMEMPRVTTAASRRLASREVVMVGILEPRKRQDVVLDAAEALWSKGSDFALHLVGRINPHFGRPIADQVRSLRRAGRPVHHHDGLADTGLRELLERARFSLLPSRAEGCGLPVLEALWAGLPVLVSDIAALAEVAEGGGCLKISPDDPDALRDAMRALLDDDALVQELLRQATTRALPTWAETLTVLTSVLGC